MANGPVTPLCLNELPDDIILKVVGTILKDTHRTTGTTFGKERLAVWRTLNSLWVLAPRQTRLASVMAIRRAILGVGYNAGRVVFDPTFHLWGGGHICEVERKHILECLNTLRRQPAYLHQTLYLWSLIPAVDFFPEKIAKFAQHVRCTQQWIMRVMERLVDTDHAFVVYMEFDDKNMQTNSRTCTLVIRPVNRVHSNQAAYVTTHVSRHGALSYRVSTEYTRVKKNPLTLHQATADISRRLREWDDQYNEPGWRK
jgi:hypothetical protein